MGQYYKKNKIGTCECMYYLTLAEAQVLASKGARDDDDIAFKEYLEDNTTRFRFPFPDEDNTAGSVDLFMAHNGKREPFKTFLLPCPIEINHDDICISNSHPGGGYNVNIFLPCLHSKEFNALNIRTSQGGAGEQFIGVEFQAIREGKIKTIFKCARCRQSQRFDDSDNEKIKERAKEYFSVYEKSNPGQFDYAMKVIERIS